jgi:2'-5' RNA ligase
MGTILTAAPKSRAHRLFFALRPDAETTARIVVLREDLGRARGFSGTLLKPDHLHVSLMFLGSWDAMPERVLARACEGAARVNARPVRVTFDRAGSFESKEGNFPFVLRSDDAALLALHASLAQALTAEKLGTLVRAAFTPHMTLLYDRRFTEETPIAPITWTAREIVLVHSLYGRNTHKHLASWPLSDD